MIGLPQANVTDFFTSQSSSFTHINLGAYITQPLYLGGQIKAESRLAEAELEVAQETEQDVENHLVFKVTCLYVRLVEIERDIRAARRSIEALEESRTNIKQMVNLNKRPRVDLLKVDTRLADVRARLIEFNNTPADSGGKAERTDRAACRYPYLC